jgi:N-acyl-D-amino-acid deacylase
MMDDPESSLNLLTQGITTINAGEGASAAPLAEDEAARRGWRTMAEYFHLLEMKGLPLNVAQTVGHSQVRRIVLGDMDRRPSDEELDQMRDLVREALEAGAIGVSTALIYPPATYARTEEIAALAEVAGEHGGGYYTHMRNEGDLLLEAIDEALDIGRTAKTPVHIFHLKTAGRQNWGKMPLAIARIKAARAAGEQVTADIYPYINNGLGIEAFIHPRHFAQGRGQLLRRLDDSELRAEIRNEMETVGGWENWYRHVGQDWSKVVIGQTTSDRYSELAGQSVAEMAKAKGEDPWETFFNLVRAGAFALPQSMTDANKILAMQQEFVSFCTDVGPAGSSQIASHPRAYGAFPRLLSRYVRDLGAISLERAVAQASAVAANDLRAYDRGRIAEGLAADVIVFDYEQLTDKATFARPHELSQGMKYVIVNGKVTLDEGKLTDDRAGRVLRGPGYRAELAPPAISTGAADERLASFDRTMREFLQKHRVPGAALAVTDQGRLVYARGYGYADVAAREPATATNLFRIASISKPITAVAILKLVEEKRLELDAKVFDLLSEYPQVSRGALAPGSDAENPRTKKPDASASRLIKEGATFDERQRNITIRHLLQHRGGWDRDVSFDAMFQSVRFARMFDAPPPAGPDVVIRAMLGQELDFDPGERYAYSNYGYCLLGRVIEKITGQSYEEYVQQQLLAPLGITSMRIGRTRLDQRLPGEVRYYHPETGKSVFADDLGEQAPWQYGGWHLEAMDAHGGWIASAVDLARFACALGDPAKSPLRLPETIAAMHERPEGLAGYDKEGKPKEVYYSLGWMNRDVAEGKADHWHTGSLNGTATILIRRHDGRNFVVLFNSRVSPHSAHLTSTIDPLLRQAADEVTEWPAHDLFAEFAGAAP